MLKILDTVLKGVCTFNNEFAMELIAPKDVL
jgi:hypothetical protein